MKNWEMSQRKDSKRVEAGHRVKEEKMQESILKGHSCPKEGKQLFWLPKEQGGGSLKPKWERSTL